MRKLQEKGVTIHRWPDSFIELLRVKWAEVLKENMDKDPLFKRVADDFLAFRKDYEIWKEHGYLN